MNKETKNQSNEETSSAINDDTQKDPNVSVTSSLQEKPKNGRRRAAREAKKEELLKKRQQAVKALEQIVPTTSLTKEVYQVPEIVLKQLRKANKQYANFEASQIIRLEDAPALLTAHLNTELGFTSTKLLNIAQKLDPRIVIDIEGEILLDKGRLITALTAYIKQQQDESLLRMSRNAKAGLRRNIINRELMSFLEVLLLSEPELLSELTLIVNNTLGVNFKNMDEDDLLAYIESFRINEEKRRLRTQEAELELQAIEKLCT